MQLILELRSLYKKHKIDYALQFTIKPNIYGALAAASLKTKTICTVTGLGYTFLNNTLSSKVAHFLYKLAFKKASYVIFQNNDDRAIFIKQNMVDEKKSKVLLGSGIDIDFFNNSFCKTKLEDEKFRFLMVARLLKDKGVYEYIKAAKTLSTQNKDMVFQLAGDIDEGNPSSIKKEELQSWINNNFIEYLGYLEDTRTAYCNADCVVLSSYREGMPRVILEALAMGKPCITTTASGCNDSILDENGIKIEPRNAEALIEALKKMKSLATNELKTISINNRKRAENVFSQSSICNKYQKLINLI